MQEVFYTILIIWVLFRIFGGKSRIYVHHSAKQQHTQEEQKKETGKITVEQNKGNKDSGAAAEYTDFEEIKD